MFILNEFICFIPESDSANTRPKGLVLTFSQRSAVSFPWASSGGGETSQYNVLLVTNASSNCCQKDSPWQRLSTTQQQERESFSKVIFFSSCHLNIQQGLPFGVASIVTVNNKDTRAAIKERGMGGGMGESSPSVSYSLWRSRALSPFSSTHVVPKIHQQHPWHCAG